MHRLAPFILSHRFHVLLSLFFNLSVRCSDCIMCYSVFKSLIHSSALFSLLFFACNLVFMSVIDLSNFEWLIIVSRSLLQWSAFLLIVLLNSFGIFITSFLNSESGILERSISYFKTRDLSCVCVFFIGMVPLLFHFIFLWLYAFRINSFLLWFWRAVFMWEHPCIAWAQYFWLRRSVFGMRACHFRPQAALAPDEGGAAVTGAFSGCWLRRSLCSMVAPVLLWQALLPTCWDRSPQAQC